MSRRVDLVIAGAGPSGLAAAIHAARAGMSVIVLDPRRAPIDKACGEGIMPSGVAELEALGARPNGASFHGVRYADAVDPRLYAVGTFHDGEGLGVRRTALHAALSARAAACGVHLERRRLARFDQLRGGVLVNGHLRARWLIGADGLASRVRRALGVERPSRGPARLGLRRHYAVRPWSPYVEVYLGERAEAYVTPVDAGLVGVALLFESRSPLDVISYARLLDGFPLLTRRLADVSVASRVRGAGPFERRVARRVVGDVLLVGDAAGYVDPITGDGIALGLATARAAVASLLEGAPASYEVRYRRITSRYVRLTSLVLAATRRRRLHRPLLRCARSFPGAFDALLAGLARLPSDHVR